MGLLDAFNSLFDGSEGHQNAGLGLLSAGLNILANNRGLNAGLPALGMGGAQGLQTYAQAQQAGMERKKMDLQSQLFGAETDYKKAQTGQLNSQMSLVKSLLGGDQSAGTAVSTPPPNSANPYVPDQSPFGMPSYARGILDFDSPQPAQQQQTQSASGQPESTNPYVPRSTGLFSPANLEKFAALKMLGGADMTDMFKYANTPQKVDAGSWQRNPITGETTYVQKPESGMYFYPNAKTFRPYGGFAESQAEIERAKVAATEREKNRYNLREMAGPNGTTVVQPVESIVRDYYGGQGGAPASWHAATVQTESGGNPYAVSPKGAMGPYQTMPGTLRDPGFGVQPARDNSPAEQTRVGREYFDTLTQRYGSPVLASIATNMGPGAFEKWVQAGADWNRLPAETRNHVGKTATLEALGNLGQRSPQEGVAPMAATQGGPTGMPQGTPQGGGQPRGFVTKDPRAENLAHFTGRGEANNMAERYKQITESAAAANSAVEDVERMLALKDKQTRVLTTGVLGNTVAPLISANASEYEKRRANLIGQLGKVFGANTDASRANVEKMVPDYGQPRDAMTAGLSSVKSQIEATQLKAQVLGAHYSAGDQAKFVAADNTLTANLHPEMMPMIRALTNPPSPDIARKAFQRLEKMPGGMDVLRTLHDAGVLK